MAGSGPSRLRFLALDITPPERIRTVVAESSSRTSSHRRCVGRSRGGSCVAAGQGFLLVSPWWLVFRWPPSSESTAPLVDDDYVTHDPWVVRGIDLTSKGARKHLEDAEGHHAGVAHWLAHSSANKSGLTSGKVDKDRYLRPHAALPRVLHGRPRRRRARGYLFGRRGPPERDSWARTGAALSLESICEVRLMSRAGGEVFGSGRGSAARR